MDLRSILLALIAMSFAFLFNLVLIPKLIELSHKKNWFDDEKDKRKIHTGKISRLGGIGIVTSAVVVTLSAAILNWGLVQLPILKKAKDFHSPLLIFIGVIIIFIVGLLDDFANLKARIKLIGQIIASIIAIAGGVQIRQVFLPFVDVSLDLNWIGPIITLLWIVGITNAINMIDGIDGLSSTITIMASLFYGIVFYINGDFTLAVLSLIVMGTTGGYLIYNFPPAKIFMGDSGSLTLGYLLAIFPLMANPIEGDSIILPALMLFIPIFDVLAAIIRRTREGKHFFTPDKEHIHHKLLSHNLKEEQILGIISIASLLSGLSYLVYMLTEGNQRYIPILIISCLMISLFIYLHYNKKDHKRIGR
ncbi:MAG: MraY family glycosyltransferase [Spirochaetales bacterium]|nr:MraY family glycosyltransferase [Spirochaetales bacterium]